MCCLTMPSGEGFESGRGSALLVKSGSIQLVPNNTQPANALSSALIDRFKATFDENPDWAWRFVPSIPFVGRHYRQGSGLLIYASAENFNWLNGNTRPDWLTNDDAWNRYRVQYEMRGRSSADFFPWVGIQPVTDGGLLAAALFVTEQLGQELPTEPRSLLEHISVSNWCKFTIYVPGENKDYIGNIKRSIPSLPYVVGELAVLQPAVVLLPGKAWKRDLFRAAMRGASPSTRFIPVPQFNGTVVSTLLGRFDSPAQELHRRYAGKPLGKWMGRLRRVNGEHAWRYIALLDEALSERLVLAT